MANNQLVTLVSADEDASATILLSDVSVVRRSKKKVRVFNSDGLEMLELGGDDEAEAERIELELVTAWRAYWGTTDGE